MRVYFVRHGEVRSNREGILYQDPEEELTERGAEQARFLAERFEKMPFDVIFASTMRRARDTALAIAERTGHDLLLSDLLVEIRRPSELRGMRKDDPAAAVIMDEQYRREADSDWRYSDEESWNELAARARAALGLIVSSGASSSVVVTHGGFLRLLIAAMVEEDDLDHAAYRHFLHFLKTKNTGITVADYEHGHWHLLTWNDHAHLGEVH